LSLQSDLDSQDESIPAGRPGRKKNPNSQAARRDQNRIAQREFRLRKQQRIRDLEARVEILSGGQDHAMDEMRNILKDLMQENQNLRTLLKSVSAFIGEGAGGLLPKLGWEMSDFNNFINKSETDTAWEGYQRRKKAAVSAELLNPSQKRPSDDADSASAKKARTSDASDVTAGAYSMLLPVSNNPINSTSLFPAPNSHDGRAMFSDVMRNGNGSPMFMSGTTSGSTPPQYNGATASSNVSGYSSTYIPSGHMNLENSLPPLSFPSSSSVSGGQSRTNDQASPDTVEDDDDPNKNEAYKLIQCARAMILFENLT
jgi:TolA-binding protein